MKKLLFTLAFVVAISGVALADYGGVIDSFSAHPNGDAISLDWRSAVENGVRSYAIERSDIKTDDFQQVTAVSASGNYSSYHYSDTRISSIQASGQSSPNTTQSDLYKYRLRINYDNAISYSQTVFVNHPSSGVRRTWGMIKEMFH